MSGPYGGNGKRTMWHGEYPECRHCGQLVHPAYIEEHEEVCVESSEDPGIDDPAGLGAADVRGGD